MFSKKFTTFFLFLYLVLIFSLFLYTFTQVDLGLTLTRSSVFLNIEKLFQYIGYFNRPLSTFIYETLHILLFVFYGIFLMLANAKNISRKQVWVLLLVTTVVLTFSYNAFSYDIFNYIFDAKIVTHYHLDPYQHKALDFPNDKMLGFMHWTQRTYPYGPIWLVLTVPLSFVGLQVFLFTFFLFKALMAVCFLGICYYIEKISKKLFPKYALYNLVFFAFNPLVIIECLVSAHNDIVMLFLAMVAFWFLIEKRYVWAFLLLFVSIGIKFATIFLLPIFLYVYLEKRIKFYALRVTLYANEWQSIFLASILLMSIALILVTLRTNFQPWYLLYLLPFASFLAKKTYILIPTFIMTFFALCQYIPFLYTGNWNPPIPTILSALLYTSILLSFFATMVYIYLNRRTR